MGNVAVKLAMWLLKKPLTIENRGLLITCILDRLSMLPLRSIISVNENGSLVIRGKVLDHEEMNIIHESSKALEDNRAFQLIQDEVLYVAHSYAVNGTKCYDDIYASKMAVWWLMEINKNIKILSSNNPDLSS